MIVAAARVIEERLRTSKTVRRFTRSSLYLLQRVSPWVHDYVRIRLRRIV